MSEERGRLEFIIPLIRPVYIDINSIFMPNKFHLEGSSPRPAFLIDIVAPSCVLFWRRSMNEPRAESETKAHLIWSRCFAVATACSSTLKIEAKKTCEVAVDVDY
jgi:hypothetical protein